MFDSCVDRTGGGGGGISDDSRLHVLDIKATPVNISIIPFIKCAPLKSSEAQVAFLQLAGLRKYCEEFFMTPAT